LVLASGGSNPSSPARIFIIERNLIMPVDEKKKDGETAVLEAIAAMPEPDRAIGKQLHTIIKASAPDLLPRTWYGMPAYTNGNKIVCFFRSRQKFGERYMTLGFNDVANLDEGNLWPITFALEKLTAAEESRIAALVKQAVS
jgi:uncharacterized protein YdhG (YjbR/CyaY superfamily)